FPSRRSPAPTPARAVRSGRLSPRTSSRSAPVDAKFRCRGAWLAPSSVAWSTSRTESHTQLHEGRSCTSRGGPRRLGRLASAGGRVPGALCSQRSGVPRAAGAAYDQLCVNTEHKVVTEYTVVTFDGPVPSG